MAYYEYTIYKPYSGEDIAASFATNEALPHILVGHALLLASDNSATRVGYQWIIDHGTVHNYRISVYATERDRAEILQR